ncbi:probable ATP-dependent DNA helicase HFM1 isoform X3 [Pseudophryne corroboree]|uniref:probable ATP-dependent DNA helicase HFM1 isoform X3 n=1 Tax=Pseudophryne corroboree TaxID=495146 RepID=UPI003081D77B
MDEFQLSLKGLFFDGLSTEESLDEQGMKRWLQAPAPSVDDIPESQDLQKEITSIKSAEIRKRRKFIPPLKKANVLEISPPGTYASQRGTHFNKTVTPNTGNTCAENVTLTYPWFSCDNEGQSTDCLTTELKQNLPQSQDIYDNSSLFRKSLFKQHDDLFQFEDRELLTENTVSPNALKSIEESEKSNYSEPFSQNLTCNINDTDDSMPNTGLDEETISHPLSLKLQSGKAETECGILRSISEIPKQFRNIFKEFPYFNYIQSKALDDLLYSDKNFVMCAPTGSGKTVIFEIAIVRLLMEAPAPWIHVKIVYMAPIKALCGQRFDDWKEKFEPIGLICKELTGDTGVDDLFEIQYAHIIMTTPEKWDNMTRKWRDNTLVQLVRLFLIDEVHTVKDESRGATLEVVVSRMKTIQVSLSRAMKTTEVRLPMRFVAVSATIPNAEDIAEWLSNEKHPAICMKMDEYHRPVKLRKVVLGFPSGSNQTEFKFDLSLNYKIAGVIQTYSDQKPTLVFCATRKGVQQAASILAKDATFIMSVEHKQRLQKSANGIKDAKLRDLLLYGVGYHHAGVDVSDRKIVEGAFTVGDLPVLFTTSTLAMGVNLPAHLVVIKSTMHYAAGMFQEYSETDILQMIGRAGRPQFDTTATAVIMTRISTREKYVHMLGGADTIESSLHRHLVEHLNAEIALHTITDVNIALEWIRSTFLYIRALKNPSHYGFPAGLDKEGIEAKLQELCLKNLNDLSSVGLIRMDEEVNFKPTESGKLMASYYIAFDTAKLFYSIHGTESLTELVTMISTCNEFSDVQLRASEKKLLNTLNKDKNRVTIRFPMEGKIKSREMKVNCLIQAQFGCILVQDFSLTQDMAKIFRHGTRVTKCLAEFLALQETKFRAFLNASILAKCFRCKLWENSSHVSKQLEKIGVTLANAMVNAGLTSFKKIEDMNARELELIVNRHPPFGNQIKESVIYLPKYELGIEQTSRYSPTVAEIVVTIMLKNFEQLQKRRTAPDFHHVTLIIGDSDNQVVFKQRIMDSVLLKSGTWARKIEIKRSSTSEELSVNLISSEYVGLDIQQNVSVFYVGPQRVRAVVGDEWKSENSISSKNTATLNFGCLNLQTIIKSRMRECNHHCKNKEACGHECCKTGVSHKADNKTNSNFSSYLSDLRSRNSVSSAPPVKRLKMQMQSEAKSMSLQKFVFKPKGPMTAFSRYTHLTAPEQAVLQQEPFHSTRSYTEQPQDGAPGCSYSGNKVCENQQSGNIVKYHSNVKHADRYSSWLLEPVNVSFDLGNDIWDEFDDDNLLDASNFQTETPVLGTKTVLCNKSHSEAKFSSPTEQKENNLNSIHPIKYSHLGISSDINIHKYVPSLGTETLNYRQHGNKIDTAHKAEQYLGKSECSREFSTLNSSYKVGNPGDFFVNNNTGHGSDNQDEDTQAFIGIFDGIF